MQAFHNMVDGVLGLDDKYKSIVIGGDLFDTPYPASFAVEFVQNEIRRFRDAGGKAYGIDGNHDIAGGKWLRVCGITPLSDEPTIIDGKECVRVCGLNYQRATELLAALSSMVDRGVKCDVLVLHLALGELNRMGAASDVTAKEMMPMLKALGVRAVLIGHIHIRQSIVIDGITFVYCGSTEVCSMNEQKDKSFEIVDIEDGKVRLTRKMIATRKIEHTVISTEAEYAKFEASVEDGSQVLQSVFVTPDITDGVKRLRDLAKAKGLMMRVQVMRTADPQTQDDQKIDRTTGIIGLEQAIGLSFKPDSKEADLIRAILRTPEAIKVIIENFMKSE